MPGPEEIEMTKKQKFEDLFFAGIFLVGFPAFVFTAAWF